MADAFKCDSCGEYADGKPMLIAMIPSVMRERMLKYEFCASCANKIAEVLEREKVFGDL